jgi:beta-lactamase superfamily II metal-dependent hydrolase
MKRNIAKLMAAGMTAAMMMNMSGLTAYADITSAVVGNAGTVQNTVSTSESTEVTTINSSPVVQTNTAVTQTSSPTVSAATSDSRSVITAGSGKSGIGGITTEGEKGYPAQDLLLGGATLTMLNSQSESQMLSCLIQTNNGSLIVVDGGLGADADYLISQIKARGGKVSAWLITHPHGDHAGALYNILQKEDARYSSGQPADITIDGIYYNFASADWYKANDPGEASMAVSLIGTLAGRPASMLHTVSKGQTFQIDNATIEVMNDRYETTTDKGNNAGIVYKVTVNGKSILFLGDMSQEGGNRILADVGAAALKSDIVQMAHHGQNGVSEAFYQAVSPSVCLWPTPSWLWSSSESKYVIQTTKAWMTSLGVQRHYCMKDGDQVIR